MEQLLVRDPVLRSRALPDVAANLISRTSALRNSLPPGVSAGLAQLVRVMNCYYSNLIEGHNTHPVDIERALNNDYSADPIERNLQIEAGAHIPVQRWIDDGGLEGREMTATGLAEIHHRFAQRMPEELLWVEHPATGDRLRGVPGAWRQVDVQVGRHVPVSSGALPRFQERFERVYGKLDRFDRILSAAAAHHRLVWIHPFSDGNGRVARLMSHAVLSQALSSGGLWSVSRGLARGEREYKRHLAACDLPRRNDYDGRVR